MGESEVDDESSRSSQGGRIAAPAPCSTGWSAGKDSGWPPYPTPPFVGFPLEVLKAAPKSVGARQLAQDIRNPYYIAGLDRIAFQQGPRGRAAAKAIERCVEQLRAVAGQSASYVNETSYFKDGWQRAFWGGSYARLGKIKQQYDPDGLFFVHHGVGSEGWSGDGFTKL